MEHAKCGSHAGLAGLGIGDAVEQLGEVATGLMGRG